MGSPSPQKLTFTDFKKEKVAAPQPHPPPLPPFDYRVKPASPLLRFTMKFFIFFNLGLAGYLTMKKPFQRRVHDTGVTADNNAAGSKSGNTGVTVDSNAAGSKSCDTGVAVDSNAAGSKSEDLAMQTPFQQRVRDTGVTVDNNAAGSKSGDTDVTVDRM